MKAIFIDIDGCLNHQRDESGNWSHAERFGLAEDLVANLRTVYDAFPDARIVISSSWRKFHDGMGVLPEDRDWHDQFAEMLGIPRDRIEDAPTLHEFGPDGVNGAKGRAHDILLWLSKYGQGDPYVVIDDECKVLRHWLGGHVVDCADNAPYGLTPERAERAITVLRAGHSVPKPKTSCGREGKC